MIYWSSSDDAFIRDIIYDKPSNENKENEPWRAFKPMMGPLWVDVNDAATASSPDYCKNSPPALVIKEKSRKRRKVVPLSELDIKDINDLLWSIEQSGRIEPLNMVLSNLPFWEAPDVFSDMCEQIESNRYRHSKNLA